MEKLFIKSTHLVFLGALLGSLLIVWPPSPEAFDQVNKNFFGVSIKGYDTVAYHLEGKAIKGERKFTYNWNDAKWYFANAKNRDLFAQNPERYAPQYGGY